MASDTDNEKAKGKRFKALVRGLQYSRPSLSFAEAPLRHSSIQGITAEWIPNIPHFRTLGRRGREEGNTINFIWFQKIERGSSLSPLSLSLSLPNHRLISQMEESVFSHSFFFVLYYWGRGVGFFLECHVQFYHAYNKTLSS